MSVGIGRERQFEIYVNGARGSYPTVPVSVDARTRSTQGHVSGGLCLRRGRRRHRGDDARYRAAFERSADRPADAPRRFGPAERHGGPWERRCRARSFSARSACSRWHIAMPTSPLPARLRPRASPSSSRTRLRDPWRRPRGRWTTPRGRLQLYWSTSNELVESLVSRAERCGSSAIVLTLDTTMLGWRIRDLDLAYLPFLRGKGIAQYTSDPSFRPKRCRRRYDRSPHPAAASRFPQSERSLLRPARIPVRDSRAFGPGLLARLSVASSRRTRGRRSRGTTSPFSASEHGCRSCSRGFSILQNVLCRDRARNGRARRVQSRRTPGGWRNRDHGCAPADHRRRRRPSAGDRRQQRGFAREPTCSARLRWARQRSGSGGPTCGDSRQVARTACAR